MLKVYDKAQWHIDAGENAEMVIAKFEALFSFLEEKELLETEGREIAELGIDSSAAIHERMVNDAGKRFMETCYDKVINKNADELTRELDEAYKLFI